MFNHNTSPDKSGIHNVTQKVSQNIAKAKAWAGSHKPQAIAIAALVAAAAIAIPATAEAAPMYRLYNPYSGEHFYTASTAERDHLDSIGWNYEGIGWDAPDTGDNVYRLYNPNSGDHHYTLSANERDMLVNVGWRYEGVGWKSADPKDGVPLYRQYNPYASSGSHNYTASKTENDYLASIGWNAEGIGWYGTKSSNNGSSNSGSASSQPSKPAHTHTWVNHTATRQVWVSNWVDVPDYSTQRVGVGTKYIFAYDGYTTTDSNDAKWHGVALIKQGVPENYRTETIYETQQVQTGSHKEDRGSYTTETYVDYVYCSSCGARQ